MLKVSAATLDFTKSIQIFRQKIKIVEIKDNKKYKLASTYSDL